MTASSPFLILHKTCDEAVVWATCKLEQVGLQALRTFDLRAARSAHLDCACPHHGTAQCDCQMVVLLVYQGDNPPLTMAIHCTDRTSRFYLINIPQELPGRLVDENIYAVLNTEIGEKA